MNRSTMGFIADTTISKLMSKLGRRRWAGKTAELRLAELAKVRAARTYTPKVRAEIGRRLTAARAAKRAAAQDS